MKKKIAAALRSLANKLSPGNVMLKPTEGELRYKGKTYSLEVLRQRRYFPGYGPDGAEDYITRDVKETLARSTNKHVETEYIEDERGRYVEGRLLILIPLN